jgi:hypothetical protein
VAIKKKKKNEAIVNCLCREVLEENISLTETERSKNFTLEYIPTNYSQLVSFLFC